MLIVNTEQHVDTGVIIEPFGKDGAVRLVPVDGPTPGRPFILDAAAAKQLGVAAMNGGRE